MCGYHSGFVGHHVRYHIERSISHEKDGFAYARKIIWHLFALMQRCLVRIWLRSTAPRRIRLTITGWAQILLHSSRRAASIISRDNCISVTEDPSHSLVPYRIVSFHPSVVRSRECFLFFPTPWCARDDCVVLTLAYNTCAGIGGLIHADGGTQYCDYFLDVSHDRLIVDDKDEIPIVCHNARRTFTNVLLWCVR